MDQALEADSAGFGAGDGGNANSVASHGTYNPLVRDGGNGGSGITFALQALTTTIGQVTWVNASSTDHGIIIGALNNNVDPLERWVFISKYIQMITKSTEQ